MQTIHGANGQIAVELARELHRGFTTDIRLVSRSPRRVNDSDELVQADLLDARQTAAAVAGSGIVYFTAGLPADADLWERQFPTMLRNALDAARAAVDALKKGDGGRAAIVLGDWPIENASPRGDLPSGAQWASVASAGVSSVTPGTASLTM